MYIYVSRNKKISKFHISWLQLYLFFSNLHTDISTRLNISRKKLPNYQSTNWSSFNWATRVILSWKNLVYFIFIDTFKYKIKLLIYFITILVRPFRNLRLQPCWVHLWTMSTLNPAVTQLAAQPQNSNLNGRCECKIWTQNRLDIFELTFSTSLMIALSVDILALWMTLTSGPIHVTKMNFFRFDISSPISSLKV